MDWRCHFYWTFYMNDYLDLNKSILLLLCNMYKTCLIVKAFTCCRFYSFKKCDEKEEEEDEKRTEIPIENNDYVLCVMCM